MSVRTIKIAKGPAPSRCAGPHDHARALAATQKAPHDNSPRASAEQLIRRAADAVGDALASVGGDPDALPPAARTHLSSLLAALGRGGPRLLTPKEAAHRAGVTAQTVIAWSVKYDIGWPVGGRWVVDAAKLDAFLMGGRS